jgi:DNA N-6-adenine-methyltransferase (Dam)
VTAGRKTLTGSRDWCTPPWLVASVRTVFGGNISLDPCSNPYSTVGADIEYLLPDRDGLLEPWDAPTIFVNPPYGTDMERGTRITDWFVRITTAAEAGSEVIALVPVAPNTWLWKKHVFPVAAAICFLYQSRLKFHIDGIQDPRGAPMACAAIHYGPEPGKFAEEFKKHGAVVPLREVLYPEPIPTLF